jgi:hypothetical protein
MKSCHKAKILLRFVGLPERLLPVLKNVLPDTDFRIARQKKTHKLVVSFQLYSKTSCMKLHKFIRENKVPPSNYGLWVSLVTEYPSGGVRVPDFAVKLLRQVGGKLDFSYTLV